MSWITLKTTDTYWEAELLVQMLDAHQIPARLLPYGVLSQFGCGTPTALQVQPENRWTALLLLSPIDGNISDDQVADYGCADEQN